MSSQAQNICMKKVVKGNRKKKKKSVPILLMQLISSLTKWYERKEKYQAKGREKGQHSRTDLSSPPSTVLLQLDELQAFPSTVQRAA